MSVIFSLCWEKIFIYSKIPYEKTPCFKGKNMVELAVADRWNKDSFLKLRCPFLSSRKRGGQSSFPNKPNLFSLIKEKSLYKETSLRNWKKKKVKIQRKFLQENRVFGKIEPISINFCIPDQVHLALSGPTSKGQSKNQREYRGPT